MTPRVLVVEDVRELRELLVEALTDEGYAVRSAEHGKAALGILEDWLPQVILLDLAMPVMDGLTFLDEIRELPEAAAVPIVVVSAQWKELGLALKRGARATVRKPYTLDHLVETIEGLLSDVTTGTVIDRRSGWSADDTLASG